MYISISDTPFFERFPTFQTDQSCCVLTFELVVSLRSNFILFYNCFAHLMEFHDMGFYV